MDADKTTQIYARIIAYLEYVLSHPKIAFARDLLARGKENTTS